MVACFRQGYVVLPCNEQLRAKDLRLRLAVCPPAARRLRRAQRDVLRGAGWAGPTVWVPGVAGLAGATPPPPAELSRARSLPDHVHERHRGRAEGRRPRPALPRRPARAGRALARARARRPRLVHGRQRLEQVGAQRLHRTVDPRRRGAAARRALRSRRAVGAARARARQRALHGADGVPRHRQARDAAPDRLAARARRRRRGAEPRGAARVGGGDRPADPRRLRPDRDRPADGHAAGRGGPAGLDGPPAARRAPVDRRRRARRRPGDGADVLPASTPATRGRRSRAEAPGAPATASPATTTATSSSRAAPTT